MDCSPPGSSVHGILQASTLKWVSQSVSSVAQLCPTLCDPINRSTPGLLKLMSIKSVMPSNHLILCYPLLFLPPIPPSIRVFSNESTLCMRWPKYWSFSFSISPCNEHPGMISFKMDWLDLLAVQGTHESSPTPKFKSNNSLMLSLLQSCRPYRSSQVQLH